MAVSCSLWDNVCEVLQVLSSLSCITREKIWQDFSVLLCSFDLKAGHITFGAIARVRSPVKGRLSAREVGARAIAAIPKVRGNGLDPALISAGDDEDLEDEKGHEADRNDGEEELLKESPYLTSSAICVLFIVVFLVTFELEERVIPGCSIVHVIYWNPLTPLFCNGNYKFEDSL